MIENISYLEAVRAAASLMAHLRREVVPWARRAMRDPRNQESTALHAAMHAALKVMESPRTPDLVFQEALDEFVQCAAWLPGNQHDCD